MLQQIKNVEAAINAFKCGKMVILVDDDDRENESDLVIPAELITPDMMNAMIRNGTGIVCLAMSESLLHKIELPLMVTARNNTSYRETPFTISIDAKDGISTGVSSADRTKTVLAAINNNAKPDDLVKPGHIFPLQARPGGVFERQGHTEGSVDLAMIAGYKQAAVICEIMNEDGTMTRGEQLNAFAKKHDLLIISVDDIMTYRYFNENLIIEEASTQIQLEQYGEFEFRAIREKFTKREHAVLTRKMHNDSSAAPLVRIHSSCTTGDIFSSRRCDCHKQLQYSLKLISEKGGILIYLNQEGRDIGLFNKIKSYALQESGLDTAEANIRLGLPVDARKYHIAANILRNRGIRSIRLLSNNPAKVNDLIKYGIENVQREPMPVFYNHYNKRYLDTKRERMNHLFHADMSQGM